jgi:putrescine transport system permease protein
MSLIAKSPKSLGAVRRAFAPWSDPTSRPLIRFENVTKRFSDVTAISDFSLDIYEREFFALLGAIDRPVEILYTNTAVYIGIVYSYLPFMVLPLYAALEKTDHALLEAASDLGSPPLRTFWSVTFPLSLPGVIAGSFLCFIPAVGEFVIPDLMGGSETLMIGKTLWTEFSVNRSWTVSSAAAIVLLMVLIAPILIYQRAEARSLEAR